jgi:hypothetical protein
MEASRAVGTLRLDQPEQQVWEQHIMDGSNLR